MGNVTTNTISVNVPVETKSKAIKETEDIRYGRTRVKGYRNVHEMFEEVLNEPES